MDLPNWIGRPGWPHVRPLGDGYRISGRCITARRWTVMTYLCQRIILLCAMILLASALLIVPATIFEKIPPPRVVERACAWLLQVRLEAKHLLVDRFPEVGKAIRYEPRSIIDWHLGGAGCLLALGAPMLGTLIAIVLGRLIPPLLRKRFVISIAEDHIRLHGRLWSRTFPRGNGVQELTGFQVRRDQEHLARPDQHGRRALLMPGLRQQPAFVELMHGLNRVRVLYVRRADDAEAIVACCNEAMSMTTRFLPGRSPKGAGP